MSISPVSALLSSNGSPGAAVSVQNQVLHTQVSQRTLKDQIDLSKEAVSLLLGGGAPPAAK